MPGLFRVIDGSVYAGLLTESGVQRYEQEYSWHVDNDFETFPNTPESGRTQGGGVFVPSACHTR
jgi:hypothetical protein